jgi:aminopeptidase N
MGVTLPETRALSLQTLPATSSTLSSPARSSRPVSTGASSSTTTTAITSRAKTKILLTPQRSYSRADTLRGSITPERAWWDVLHYHINIRPDFATKSLQGSVTIAFALTPNASRAKRRSMQLDLQQPLVVDSIIQYAPYRRLQFTREDNVCFVDLCAADVARQQSTKRSRSATDRSAVSDSLVVFYHGSPREAVLPPWNGGWIWKQDSLGRPWMSVACQGLGASVWYPCKDHQSDEPDNGAWLTVTVPDTLVAVGNGRLLERVTHHGTARYTWCVRSPINNYNIVPYIGKYVLSSDTLHGESGVLDLDFWVLDYDSSRAARQFQQVKPMLRCFEYWFGAYPFYKDGYKLVQAPHLGMEHQSAIAYGNGFRNGYRGSDLSATGWGLLWDFIIVHESGHEWFANSITTRDIADMWVHEGFTCYSETLYTEWVAGQRAAREYNRGLRKNILNDKPIIAPYGVNQEGSVDMYFKAANMLHLIRSVLTACSGDTVLFRTILRGLNSTFYHQTISTQDVERFINQYARRYGVNLQCVFDQYLRTTAIPTLRYKLSADSTRLIMRWDSCVRGFALPLLLPDTTRTDASTINEFVFASAVFDKMQPSQLLKQPSVRIPARHQRTTKIPQISHTFVPVTDSWQSFPLTPAAMKDWQWFQKWFLAGELEHYYYIRVLPADAH